MDSTLPPIWILLFILFWLSFQCASGNRDCPPRFDYDVRQKDCIPLLQQFSGVYMGIDIIFTLTDYDNIPIHVLSNSLLCPEIVFSFEDLGLTRLDLNSKMECQAAFSVQPFSQIGVVVSFPLKLGGQHATYESIKMAEASLRKNLSSILPDVEFFTYFYQAESPLKIDFSMQVFNDTPSYKTVSLEIISEAFRLANGVDYETSPCSVVVVSMADVTNVQYDAFNFSFEYAEAKITINRSQAVIFEDNVLICKQSIAEFLKYIPKTINRTKSIPKSDSVISMAILEFWVLPPVSWGIFLVHLITYVIQYGCKNIADGMIIHLTIICFLGQLLSSLPAMIALEEGTACMALMATAHFLLLVSFLWLTSMSFTAFHGITSSLSWSKSPKIHLLAYVGTTYTIPLLMVSAGVVSDMWDIVPVKMLYCQGSCFFGSIQSYLLLIVAPTSLAAFLNALICIRLASHSKCGKVTAYAVYPDLLSINSCYKMVAMSSSVTLIGCVGLIFVGLSVASVGDLCYLATVFRCLQGIFMLAVSLAFKNNTMAA